MAQSPEVFPMTMPPALPGHVSMHPDIDEVFDALGADMLLHAHNCVRTFGDFHLALSGGSTPLPFYERLMYDPRYRGFPWPRTHLWLVDERRVDFTSDLSNWKHINQTIVQHAGIPAEQAHPILATEPDAAERYERLLKESMGWREKGQDRLDFVMLGMGDNGHTASLFPNTDVLEERVRLVSYCDGPTVTPPARVTLTYPAINSARYIAVLVAGADKASMIDRVVDGSDSYRELPIKGIKPLTGELKWFLDFAACGK
ncbi:MAG: 6-phosphogluconolactonase [Phycisphaerales bacterium]|nr:6-phosphogluconolactonase [Phycisphaerales bacterium]